MKVMFLLLGHMYYSAELSAALTRAGHKVAIATDDKLIGFVGTGSGDPHADYREILHPDVDIEFISVPADTNPGTVIANLASIAAYARAIRKFNPDVVHVHDVADYRIFCALKLACWKRPLVMTVHDAELHPGDGGNKFEFLRPKARLMADAIIVHGKDIKSRLHQVAPDISEKKVNIIPHGVYTLYRRWLSDNIKKSRNKVLTFGRIRKYKGIDYLIKSAPIVRESVPDAKIVIAGSGPDWPRCEAMIEDPSMFEIHNEDVTDDMVTRLFQEAAVIVLPYIEASQSGVLNIAYALGRPVIVTNVGSLPEVVEDGVTGFVVPPADEKALAVAIVKVLSDHKLADEMGENAYQRAVKGELSWDSVAEKTISVYQNVAGNG